VDLVLILGKKELKEVVLVSSTLELQMMNLRNKSLSHKTKKMKIKRKKITMTMASL